MPAHLRFKSAARDISTRADRTRSVDVVTYLPWRQFTAMASLNHPTEARKESEEGCAPYSCRRPVRCQPAPTAQTHQLPSNIDMTPRLRHTRSDVRKVLLNQFWVSYIFRTLVCFVKKKKNPLSSSLLVKSYQPTRRLPDNLLWNSGDGNLCLREIQMGNQTNR